MKLFIAKMNILEGLFHLRGKFGKSSELTGEYCRPTLKRGKNVNEISDINQSRCYQWPTRICNVLLI